MGQLLPNDAQCENVIKELLEHHEQHGELTPWEYEFCESNSERTWFSDKQKLVIQRFAQKYHLKSYQ